MDESFTQLPRSDAELITAIGSGDETAYDMLRERHLAAARDLAAQLSADPAEAEAIVSQTFTQIRNLLGEGRGPRVAMRPYLFTAVRWAAHERLTASGGTGADTAAAAASTAAAGREDAATAEIADAGTTAAKTPDISEPLFTDPDIADLVRSPLYLAFMSLPERFRAVLWHAEVERSGLAETGAVLGLTPGGTADLARQARTALREAYLRHYPVAQDAELAELGGPLRAIVGPVFLGAASAAYLSAGETTTRPAGQGLGGLLWMRQGPNQAGPGRRSRRVLTVGGIALGLFAAAGLVLALTSAAGPQSPAAAPQHPVGAQPAPSGDVVSPSPVPTFTNPPAMTLSTPAPTPTPSPSPATLPPPLPTPTSVLPTVPVTPSPRPTPSPCPTPTIRFKHHRCPPPPA